MAKAKKTATVPRAYFLGPTQIAWLKQELANSRATWKVIAADMPISLLVVYDVDRKWGVEAVAQGDDGPPRGRELEIADLLSFIKRAGVRNTVWITADVHYTAAHYYDPEQGSIPGFRAVLGICVRPASRGHVRPQCARHDFRTAARLHKGSEQGARPEPAAE